MAAATVAAAILLLVAILTVAVAILKRLSWRIWATERLTQTSFDCASMRTHLFVNHEMMQFLSLSLGSDGLRLRSYAKASFGT